MEQIERITYMEQILDEAAEVASSLSDTLKKYSAIQPRLQELSEYYSSPQWRQDFEDDSTGKLPCDLKRGVLSEDGIYDLLSQFSDLKKQLQELTQP